jgi:hypothetical protein
MHDFLPKPRHDSDQWKHFGTLYQYNNPNCASDAFEGFTSHSFMAWGSFSSERDAPANGYMYPFNTVTDCLLWLRWAALPMIHDYIRPSYIYENFDELIQQAETLIDSAPPQTDADLLLEELKFLWDTNVGGFNLSHYCSVTEYLDEHGTEEGWQEYLEDPTVLRESDGWVMSEAGWKTLEEKFSSSPGDIIGPPEQWEDDDDDDDDD